MEMAMKWDEASMEEIFGDFRLRLARMDTQLAEMELMARAIDGDPVARAWFKTQPRWKELFGDGERPQSSD